MFVVVLFVYLFFKGNILVEKPFQILVCMMEQFSSTFMRTLNLRSIDYLENIMSALQLHFPFLTRLYWLQILSD